MASQALVIVDMQVGSFTEANPRYDDRRLVERLNALAAQVRSTNGVVIFVQHEGPPGDPHHPSLPGFQLLPSLDVTTTDIRIFKKSCDSFLATELEDILCKSSITKLIITGCATDYCVDTTVRSALAKGYKTIVPVDGHTTSDRPHLPAVKIIEHHNAIWADFISPAGPAVICLCDEAAL